MVSIELLLRGSPSDHSKSYNVSIINFRLTCCLDGPLELTVSRWTLISKCSQSLRHVFKAMRYEDFLQSQVFLLLSRRPTFHVRLVTIAHHVF